MKKLISSYLVLLLGSVFSILVLPWIIRSGGKDVIALSVLISSGITYISLSDFGLASFLSRGRISLHEGQCNSNLEEINLIRDQLPVILMRSVVIAIVGYAVFQNYSELSWHGGVNPVLLALLLLLIAISKPMDSIYQGLLLGRGAITKLNLINVIAMSSRWVGLALVTVERLNNLFIYFIYGLISLPSALLLIIEIYKKKKIKLVADKYKIIRQVFLSTITGTVFVSIDKYLVLKSGLDLEMINGYISSFGVVAPILSIIYPIMQIFQYKITNNKNNKINSSSMYIKIIIMTLGVYLTPLVLMFTFSNEIVPLWLGENFSTSTNLLNIKIALLCAIFYGISHIISMEIISNIDYKYITYTNILSIIFILIGAIIQNYTKYYIYIYAILLGTIVQFCAGIYYLAIKYKKNEENIINNYGN